MYIYKKKQKTNKLKKTKKNKTKNTSATELPCIFYTYKKDEVLSLC